MDTINLKKLKLGIQVQAKNGIDFIIAAGILWLLISYIWTIDQTSYNKSIFTFMIGAILLPLAYGFSKVLRTNWKVKDNPLQPLGLWLNFAQLVYFPFLIFGGCIKHSVTCFQSVFYRLNTFLICRFIGSKTYNWYFISVI